LARLIIEEGWTLSEAAKMFMVSTHHDGIPQAC
jgi:hypothetical protein